MANTQYLKYKDEFKKQCIFNTVFGGLAILTIIMLLFVPLFEVKVLNILILQFSLFDEIKLSFSSLGRGGVQITGGSAAESWRAVASFMGIYQIIAIIMFAVAIGWFIFELIKNIMGIMNMDNYALEQYDKIKKRSDENGKKGFKRFSSSGLFLSGIIMEVFYLFYSKFIMQMIGMSGSGIASDSASYFTSMTGVSWTIMFPIIFAVGAIAMFVLRKMSLSKTRAAILKEDYDIAENNDNNDKTVDDTTNNNSTPTL